MKRPPPPSPEQGLGAREIEIIDALEAQGETYRMRNNMLTRPDIDLRRMRDWEATQA